MTAPAKQASAPHMASLRVSARYLATLLLCCAASAPGMAASPEAESLQRLRQLIGDAPCGADAQCRTVAIGQRACGGPAAYLAWSVQHSDAQALQQAVARYNALQAKAQPPGSQFSTCEVLQDPGAVCLPAARPTAAGTCQLRPKPGSTALPSR